MTKTNALQKIESHEKLCRIMQKQTHDKILKLEQQINRVESILLVSVGANQWYGLPYFYISLTIRLVISTK